MPKDSHLKTVYFQKSGSITFLYDDVGAYTLEFEGSPSRNWESIFDERNKIHSPDICMAYGIEVLAAHILELNRKVDELKEEVNALK